MRTDRQLDDTIGRWLEAEAPRQLPDRVLRATFERTRKVRQQVGWRALLRRLQVNRMFPALAGVAAVVVVALVAVGLYFNQPGVGGVPPTQPPAPTPSARLASPSPTHSATELPTPTPTLLARGNFNVAGRTVELDAAGTGSSVTGSMYAADDNQVPPEDFTVDLQCTRANEDGVIWIGGDITDSSTGFAPAGTWAGIVLQRGSPVQAHLVYQLDDPRAASCLAFLEQMISYGVPVLEPIEGTVELGP